MNLAGIVRRYCPDVKWIRDRLKWAKIRDIDKASLSRKQIAAGEADKTERDRLVKLCQKRWGREYREFEEAINRVINDEAGSGNNETYSIQEDSIISTDDSDTSNANNQFFVFIKSFIVNIDI